MSNKESFVQSNGTYIAQITNAIGTAITDLINSVGASSGGDETLRALAAYNADTAAIVLNVYERAPGGAVDALIGSVSCPAASATNILSALSHLTESDPNGNRQHFMQAGTILRVAAATAPASGKFLNVIAVTGKY